MGVRATSHVAIGVRDMERSLRFYRDLLGLHVTVDREERYHDRTPAPHTTRRSRKPTWSCSTRCSHSMSAGRSSSPSAPTATWSGVGTVASCSCRSATGLYGRSAAVGYAAGKGGVVGLMNVFAIEGREHGVLANAITPIAQTSIIERSHGTPADAPVFLSDPRMQPSFVTPLVAYLASSACQTTRGIFSAVGGRYARVSIGVTRGWRVPDDAVAPGAEDLARNWTMIDTISVLSFPGSVREEATLALATPAADAIDATDATLHALAPAGTGPPSSLSDAQRVALRYVACANASDADAAADLFADDATWCGQVDRPHVGASAIRELYHRLYANKAHIRIARWIAEGRSCAFELELVDPVTCATRRGPFDYLTLDDRGKICRLDVFGPPRS
jgi:hypothetical protein